MLDFAWSELGLIALVSVLVLGPKQLPETMRTMAKVMRKVKNLGSEFQGHVNEMVREAELDDVRKQVQQLSQTNITKELSKVVDPTGELKQTFSGEGPSASAALAEQKASDDLAEQAALEATEAADAARAAASSEAPAPQTAGKTS